MSLDTVNDRLMISSNGVGTAHFTYLFDIWLWCNEFAIWGSLFTKSWRREIQYSV